MKFLLAVLLLPSLAFCDVPDFLRSLPVSNLPNPLIDNDGNEEIVLDGKPAIRTHDGRIIRGPKCDDSWIDRTLDQNHGVKPVAALSAPDPKLVKIIESIPEESIRAQPEFEADAPVRQFNIQLRQRIVTEVKKAVDVPITAFKAAPAKAEEKLAEIVPFIERPRAAKTKHIELNLDAQEFVETSSEKPAEPAKIVPQKIEKQTPTAEQLAVMRQYGLSCPPEIKHLDGSVTKGISNACQNGGCQFNATSEKVQYDRQGTVECESCRLRGMRR